MRLCPSSILNFEATRIIKIKVHFSGSPGILSGLASILHWGGLLNCDNAAKTLQKKDPGYTEGYPVVHPTAGRRFGTNTSLDHGAPAVAKYKLMTGP